MKTYQTLEIRLESNNYSEFVLDLSHLINESEWKVRQDLIDNYKKNTFSKEKEILCVETTEYVFEDKRTKGTIWLWDYNGFLELFNIIPLIGHSLDYDQYNYLLNIFYKRFIHPLEEKYGAEVRIGEPIKKLISTIGDDAYRALQSFSDGANKTTGNTHHFDFERWCQFIFIIFRKNIELHVDDLIIWLEENGWDSDMANRLGLEYEYSINLLEKYERN